MSAPLVVVPTYDEIGTIEEVVRRVLAAPVGAELLVVDDASPDGTGRLVDRLAADEPRLHALHRTGKGGLGSAYRAGLRWGLDRGHELLVEMDADLSHDPAALPRLLAAADEADLVIGSRYVAGGDVANWPRHRLALSSGGNLYVRTVTGLPVHDATSGYRLFHAAVLEEIGIDGLESEGYSFQLETALAAWRAGFRIVEVPILFTERTVGASKISRGIIAEALWRVVQWGVRGPRGPRRAHPRSVAADR